MQTEFVRKMKAPCKQCAVCAFYSENWVFPSCVILLIKTLLGVFKIVTQSSAYWSLEWKSGQDFIDLAWLYILKPINFCNASYILAMALEVTNHNRKLSLYLNTPVHRYNIPGLGQASWAHLSHPSLWAVELNDNGVIHYRYFCKLF